ncbi:MAG: hypothetical protein WD773_02280 [Gemmatimonadales bacterium]
MINQMLRAPIGSVWSVSGLGDAAVVVLAGPFATSRGSPEYLVAPLYTGREPGFVWSSEDVRLEANESGFGEPRFAAVWNARPLLYSDLPLQLGTLTEDATVAVRDAYWASLNERALGKSRRLGRSIRSAKDAAAMFQAAELERWEPLSGRVFDAPEHAAVSLTVRFADVWTMTLPGIEQLSSDIETSERLVGSAVIDGIGASKAWLSGWLHLGGIQVSRNAGDLFAPAPSDAVQFWQETTFVAQRDAEEAEVPVQVNADSELADAA